MTAQCPTLEEYTRASRRKPPKYFNRKVPGLTDGFLYDSEKEMLHGEWLLSEKRAGRLTDVKRQVRFVLYAAGPDGQPVKLKHYCKVDFVVTYPHGQQEIHEVKGYINDKDPATRLCRLNWAMIEANNPSLRVRIFE